MERNIQASLVFLDPITDATPSRLLDLAQKEVNRQLRVLSKHKEMRKLIRRLMDGGVVAKDPLREKIWPVVLMFRGECAEKVMHCAVKPLTLAITLWMVGCCSGFLDPVQVT